MTSSADGRHPVAAAGVDSIGASYIYGFIHALSHQGLTWTQRSTEDAWTGLASSANGKHLAAVSSTYGGAVISLSSPRPVAITTTGSGWITGKQYHAIELRCVGSRHGMVLDAIGTGFHAE